MNFRPLNEILGFYPDLRVLEKNSQKYRLMLYQHSGNLIAAANRIGNNSLDATVKSKFIELINKANQAGSDLLLSPEYSCPWEIISEIITKNNYRPGSRKLWVLGCESITKEEINKFKSDFHSNEVFIYFDESLLDSNNTFFDPIVYIFQSVSGGVSRLNIIIQFKTYHMSVWNGGEIERDNIILGNEIYVLRNETNSISFLTLTCSEAMNFPDELAKNPPALGWDEFAHLIFNPQFNGEPTHAHFINFRSRVMFTDRKEIITLNWKSGSKVNGQDLISSNSSRSGFTVRSQEINLNDKTSLRNNHTLGLYYLNYGLIDRHAFLCNSKVDCFLIDNSSIQITNVLTQQARRDGPVVTTSYRFDNDQNLTPIDLPVTDSSLSYFDDIGCQNGFLRDVAGCLFEKERLVCLSAAEFLKSTSEWYQIDQLYSFRIDTSDVNRRITFAEDESQHSKAQREKYMTAISQLADILTNHKQVFPASMNRLKTIQLQIGYFQGLDHRGRKFIEIEKYKYNVLKQNGEKVVATVSYLGQVTQKDASKKFSLIQQLFDDNEHRKAVVVFYHLGGVLRSIGDDSYGDITDPIESPGPNINS